MYLFSHFVFIEVKRNISPGTDMEMSKKVSESIADLFKKKFSELCKFQLAISIFSNQ